MKPNPDWKTPEDGEITGVGITSNGRFMDVFFEKLGDTRRFWNFDTSADDAVKQRNRRSIEAKIKSGKFYRAEP